MELNIACATWIKEDDEKVINVLEATDKSLSNEEIAEITGLPMRKVDHTLLMLKKQEAMYKSRKVLNDYLNG